ncbi:MAG TPA: hypothetical protein VJ780_01495 [Flavobacterium sp.]|nr:hypothetical protein [Flavobacterium sp.]
MKLKLILLLSICIGQLTYSQTHKLLRGKVMSENFLLQNVNVINKNTEKVTATNEKGEFIIAASVNDSILFFDKDYHLKGIKLTLENLETNNLIIPIDKKPEELKEVVIRPVNIDWKFDKKWEQLKRDEVAVYRKSNALKNPGVKDGTIENGMNFVKIGKMLFGGLFKAKKEKNLNPEDFKEIAKASFDEKFYTETLKLKKQEIEAFLTFCNFDPESKNTISENSNDLILMDFLHKKSIEFKKINAPE